MPSDLRASRDITAIMPSERVFSDHEDYVNADAVDGEDVHK